MLNDIEFKLRNSIINYIYSNLGINNNIPSIINDLFIIPSQIEFEYLIEENNVVEKVNVWGCQTIVSNSKIELIFTQSSDDDLTQYLVIKLENCPAYGCILSEANSEADIYYEITDKNWVKAPIYLQATFLAGMEKLKEVLSKYYILTNHEQMFFRLKDFIDFTETQHNIENAKEE